MRRHLFIAWSVWVLLSCAETARTCPEGMWRPAGSDTCQPIPDASFDAGPDSGEPDADVSDDAGPCGACTSMGMPNCDEASRTCVECTERSHCAAPTPSCDLATHRCTECMIDGDCTTVAAAHCEAGECVGCTDSGQCAGFAGARICDTAMGRCVECHELEDDACAGRDCTTANVCSAYDNDRITCQSCDTDANCSRANHLCVPMDFMGSPHGYFCLEKFLAAGCQPPFSSILPDRISASGETTFRYCGFDEGVRTCEAVRALMDAVGCPTGSECPRGGLCEMVGSVPRQCTYQCSTPRDCLTSMPEDTCGLGSGGGTVLYCGG